MNRVQRYKLGDVVYFRDFSKIFKSPILDIGVDTKGHIEYTVCFYTGVSYDIYEYEIAKSKWGIIYKHYSERISELLKLDRLTWSDLLSDIVKRPTSGKPPEKLRENHFVSVVVRACKWDGSNFDEITNILNFHNSWDRGRAEIEKSGEGQIKALWIGEEVIIQINEWVVILEDNILMIKDSDFNRIKLRD